MIEVGPATPESYPWIARKANLVLSEGFRAIQAVQDGQIVGMVGYDGWTPNSCAMHVAIDKPIAIRRMIRLAFEIPFVRLGRGVVLGSVLSDNPRALELDLHLGFKTVGFIPDAWAAGVGLHILMMRREECRWLKE